MTLVEDLDLTIAAYRERGLPLPELHAPLSYVRFLAAEVKLAQKLESGDVITLNRAGEPYVTLVAH